MQSKELQIGKAGEYLVCADLILKGFVAFPSEQGLPYDVLLDNGNKLLRVQVKTTEKPRLVTQRKKSLECYIFNVKRHGNRNNLRIYKDNEIDVFALVCLDTKEIGYLKNCQMPTTINLRCDKIRGNYHDEKGLVLYHKISELRNSGESQKSIAKKLNTHVSIVNRMVKDYYLPYQTKAKYFSDTKKDKEWFLTL